MAVRLSTVSNFYYEKLLQLSNNWRCVLQKHMVRRAIIMGWMDVVVGVVTGIVS